MSVIFGEDALSESTVEQLLEYINECKKKYAWGSNFYFWRVAPISAGVVLTHQMPEEWTNRLFVELHARGKLPYHPQRRVALFFAWHSGSNIAWHTDYVELSSMTIYLSRDWDPNFGGYFCWKDWDGISARLGFGNPPPKEAKMRLPSYNNYVYMTEAEWHTTTITASSAPPRLSLQMFFSKDQSASS